MAVDDHWFYPHRDYVKSVKPATKIHRQATPRGRPARSPGFSLVSSKHQVVIPEEARRAVGIKAGDRIAFVAVGGLLQVVKVPDIRHCVGLFPDLKNTFDRDADNGDRELP